MLRLKGNLIMETNELREYKKSLKGKSKKDLLEELYNLNEENKFWLKCISESYSQQFQDLINDTNNKRAIVKIAIEYADIKSNTNIYFSTTSPLKLDDLVLREGMYGGTVNPILKKDTEVHDVPLNHPYK